MARRVQDSIKMKKNKKIKIIEKFEKRERAV